MYPKLTYFYHQLIISNEEVPSVDIYHAGYLDPSQ